MRINGYKLLVRIVFTAKKSSNHPETDPPVFSVNDRKSTKTSFTSFPAINSMGGGKKTKACLLSENKP